MDQGEEKTGKNFAEILEKLKQDEVIDVLVYVNQPTTSFDEYLRGKKEIGELNFNFLEFANCYVIEASKNSLLEILDRKDVFKMEINPRFGVD